jgi:hypothetical protein
MEFPFQFEVTQEEMDSIDKDLSDEMDLIQQLKMDRLKATAFAFKEAKSNDKIIQNIPKETADKSSVSNSNSFNYSSVDSTPEQLYPLGEIRKLLSKENSFGKVWEILKNDLGWKNMYIIGKCSMLDNTTGYISPWARNYNFKDLFKTKSKDKINVSLLKENFDFFVDNQSLLNYIQLFLRNHGTGTISPYKYPLQLEHTNGILENMDDFQEDCKRRKLDYYKLISTPHDQSIVYNPDASLPTVDDEDFNISQEASPIDDSFKSTWNTIKNACKSRKLDINNFDGIWDFLQKEDENWWQFEDCYTRLNKYDLNNNGIQSHHIENKDYFTSKELLLDFIKNEGKKNGDSPNALAKVVDYFSDDSDDESDGSDDEEKVTCDTTIELSSALEKKPTIFNDRENNSTEFFDRVSLSILSSPSFVDSDTSLYNSPVSPIHNRLDMQNNDKNSNLSYNSLENDNKRKTPVTYSTNLSKKNQRV